MAPRPLSPLVLALGGAAAVLGSVLFILWKAYFGRGRERRWDRGEGWWGVEPARLPDWDEWDVSVGLVRLPASDGRARFQGLELPPAGPCAGSRAVVGRRTEEPVEVWGGGWGRTPASSRAVSGPHQVQPAPAQRLRSARLWGCRERSYGPSVSWWLRCAAPPTPWF